MKSWGAIAVVAVLAVVGAGYLEMRSPPGDQRLSARIAAEVRRGDGTTLDLAKLAPFHWTDFYVFGPYSRESDADRRMGRPWRYRWSAVEYQDDRSFLVFADSGKVVAAFDHFRDRGDFTYYGHSPGIRHLARDEAKFRVRSDSVPLSNGRRYYRLELQK